MQYRPEIDGLRALAILPVIFFHADFIWFSGGLLGVDVFFVISGYLISSIILTEQQQQRFSLMYFYERRARRILPALFFVLLCSSIAAGFILAPHALVDFSYSVMATVGFVANLFFWQTTGYFDGDAALKPLLHLWSLGIEEQFYLFFPLLLVWCWRWRSAQQLKIVLALLFIGSLAAAQWSSQTHSDTGFYLLPMRAWELLAGVFCAYYLQYVATKSHLHTPLALQQLGSIAGLLLLGISFVLLGAPTSHPSLWTLVPVGGAATKPAPTGADWTIKLQRLLMASAFVCLYAL